MEKRLKFLGEHELRLLDIQLSGKYPESTIEAKLEAIHKETVDIQGQLKRLDENSPEKEMRTLEQVKNIFLSPYLAEKDFLLGDELKQHSALEKLLLNASFQQKKMALYKLKQPYQILAAVPNKADFSLMRGRRNVIMNNFCPKILTGLINMGARFEVMRERIERVMAQ